MFIQILLAIIGLSLLVVVHEAGHYLAARASGMRVTKFSIGFGPALLRYQPQGSPTVFQICVIPLLAYVAIAGMNPAENIDRNDPELFPNKSVFARIAAIFAGPFANYLAASLLIFGLALVAWPDEVVTEPMVIGSVSPSLPAAEAGLQPGDIIRQAEGRPVHNVQELIAITKPRAGKSTRYVLERKGVVRTVILTPIEQDGRGVIGVTPNTQRRYISMPFVQAAAIAVELPYRLTEFNLQVIGELISRRSTEGITGPVGIGKIMVQQAEKGAADFIFILIQISVALGMFNLLPFPALDGGRLMFLTFEVFTKRRVDERIETAIHTAGLIFFLALLLLVTLRDIGG